MDSNNNYSYTTKNTTHRRYILFTSALIFTFSSATKRLTELTNLVKRKFSLFYNDEMTNEWIWDKIKSTLTRAEEMERYLKEIQNTTLQAEQQVLKQKIT